MSRFKPATVLTTLLLLCFGNSTNAEIVRDVIYGHKDGMALVMDVYQPEGNANGGGAGGVV